MQGLISQPIKQFFAWWGKELFALLPEAWQGRLQVADNILLLRHCPDGIRVIWINDSQRMDFGTFAVNDTGRTAWQERVAKYSRVSKASRILVLSPTQCFNRRILLPKQAAGNLHQVMGFEMDRYTPITAKHAYFDIVSTNAPVQEGQFEAFFVVTPKTLLEPMLEQCRFFDLSPNTVSYSATPALPLDAANINVLPDDMRPPVNKKERVLTTALVVLLLLGVSVALAYPTWAIKHEVTELQARIAAIKDDVTLVGKMRTSIESTDAQIKSLLNKKTSRPYAVDILLELTKRLPADSWLTNLRLTGSHLQIQGYSENATGLIQLLENSPLFSNTRFTSPLASNKAPQQAFKIGIDLVRGVP